MALFDDEEGGNEGIIALAEIKKVKRVVSRLYEELEEVTTAVESMKRGVSRMEGVVDTVLAQSGRSDVNVLTGDSNQVNQGNVNAEQKR